MMILWISFLGSSKNWTFLCILGSFPKANVQNGGSFFGLLKFHFFLVLEILDIFEGEHQMLGTSQLIKKK